MTSEFKGTDGEWGLIDIEDRGWTSRKLVPAKMIGKRPLSLLSTDKDGTAYVWDEHDARLFAASKDLLEALIVTAKWMEWWVSENLCECEYGHICGLTERRNELAKARAAIAKALGDTDTDPANRKTNAN